MAGHDHYFDAKANHQAAYDSLLTAKVFLRMSAFLEAEGDYVDVSDQMRHTLMKNPDALARSLMTRKSEEARARREAQNPQPLPQPPIKVYGKTPSIEICAHPRPTIRIQFGGLCHALLLC